MEDRLAGYMAELTGSAPKAAGFNSARPWAEWRGELAERFAARLGPVPEMKAELNAVELERTMCKGHTRERVEITTFEGLRMAVYLLIPDQPLARPCPAVIALHGHGYGSRDIVGLTPEGEERTGDPGLHRDFAVSLVQAGFVVAAPEILGFGDRRLQENLESGQPAQNSCFRLSAALLLAGHTMAGYRVYETTRVLDYLETRPEVLAERIGVMGISGGGLVAGFTAALDQRIKCAVVSGYASTFEASILSRSHCLDNYIPGILLDAEMPDLLGLIAPRGLFLECGAVDHLFPRHASEEALGRLQEIYTAAGTPDGVEADFFDGGHEIHGGPAYEWLTKQLDPR